MKGKDHKILGVWVGESGDIRDRRWKDVYASVTPVDDAYVGFHMEVRHNGERLGFDTRVLREELIRQPGLYSGILNKMVRYVDKELDKQ